MTTLKEKALKVSYFSVCYHLIEGLLSVITGASTGSIALLGFGLDSFVESLSGFVIIWRFSSHENMPEHEEEKIEKRALRLIAYSFFALAAYVVYESSKKFYFREISQPSLFGIIIAVASLVVMPILSFLKRDMGKSLKSHSLVADSKQQFVCTLLSVALLVGLGLNYFFGFWQADPLMGFVIFFYLIKEGIATLKEERLCSC